MSPTTIHDQEIVSMKRVQPQRSRILSHSPMKVSMIPFLEHNIPHYLYSAANLILEAVSMKKNVKAILEFPPLGEHFQTLYL